METPTPATEIDRPLHVLVLTPDQYALLVEAVQAQIDGLDHDDETDDELCEWSDIADVLAGKEQHTWIDEALEGELWAALSKLA